MMTLRWLTPSSRSCWLLIGWLVWSRFGVAQTLPPNFGLATVASGLSTPTVVVSAPDGRLFITEQNGRLRVVRNGNLLPTPFAQLTVDASGERGLIGLALDPDFATTAYLYVYYTVPANGPTPPHNRISRLTAAGDVMLAGSEVVVLDLDPLSGATNHNGGSMVFGADRKLYVGVGDNAFGSNAQNLDTYLGKVLRINPDGSAPADNPFPTGSAARRRVWAYGVRNPYTLTVQPRTGRLFVNDVGQETWEEINDATTGGLNFGWPNAEGMSSNPAYTNPVYAYAHGGGDGVGCAITGGAFYSPALAVYPATYVGRYVYQDFCNNWLNTLDLSGTTAIRSAFATGLNGYGVGLTLGTDGYLYFLSWGTGALLRLTYTGDVACRTNQAGDWQTAGLWSCGQAPVSGVRSVVRHAVTLGAGPPRQAAQVNLEAGGKLSFAVGSQLRLGF
ncbi:HHIP-like protein 2 [Fibrella aestuarina BUZ 2]|uniref:HHIP-like protein 2 n=1 Tax=Fibrella aestuarina BUZ 2 TaxID=1166018 RepID=I0K922_9BACT|nr:PQQ-dependent sugar dehydrogenase [Fibrella aestuarina]CCH00625.1 HHIP-like protein 2 [Fibrella aestuarina BUZ 2]